MATLALPKQPFLSVVVHLRKIATQVPCFLQLEMSSLVVSFMLMLQSGSSYPFLTLVDQRAQGFNFHEIYSKWSVKIR